MTSEARDPAYLDVMDSVEVETLATGFDWIPCYRVARKDVRAFDLSADVQVSRGKFHVRRRRSVRPVYHCIDRTLPGAHQDTRRTVVLNAKLATKGEA